MPNCLLQFFLSPNELNELRMNYCMRHFQCCPARNATWARITKATSSFRTRGSPVMPGVICFAPVYSVSVFLTEKMLVGETDTGNTCAGNGLGVLVIKNTGSGLSLKYRRTVSTDSDLQKKLPSHFVWILRIIQFLPSRLIIKLLFSQRVLMYLPCSNLSPEFSNMRV